MNGKKVLSAAEPVVTQIVEELGYELVDIDYRKEHYGMILEVVIYKDGGIDINDCELVSKALDEPLDNLDPTNGAAYSLNVSSPGLDRPLKKQSDFKRNIGNEVKVKFFAPFNGKKEYVGILTSYTDKTFIITSNEESIEIEISKTAKIEPVIKF
jgi:ribosome maturation factor RimP